MAKGYLHAQFCVVKLDVLVKQDVFNAVESINLLIYEKISNSILGISEKKVKFKIKKIISAENSPQLNTKKNRQEYAEDHRKKVKDCKEFTNRIAGEKKERQKRIQERETEFRQNLLKEIEDQKKSQELVHQKLETEKQVHVASMRKNTELRTKVLQSKREEIQKQSPSPKPLYKQMEEFYKINVVMPRLEQHKAELARKRMIFKPLDPIELQEHSKHHDELKKLNDYRRRKENEQKTLDSEINHSTNTLHSKFTIAVLEHEKKIKEQQDKAKEEKLLNIQKRFQYSKLVNEMFLPAVNESFKVENSNKSLKSSKSGENSLEKKKKIGVTDYKSELGFFRPLKKKMEAPEKKKVFVPDYLAESKRNREIRDEKINEFEMEKEKMLENFDENKAQKILARAELIESKAKQKELFLGDLKFKSKKGIDAGVEVSDLILASIKAKLAILDKFQDDS